MAIRGSGFLSEILHREGLYAFEELQEEVLGNKKGRTDWALPAP